MQFWNRNIFNSIKSKGFTLGEVLVTLAIVGVISALTIPGITNYINEQQYNAGVTKAYSLLSQAIINIQNNNGTVQVGTAAGWAAGALLRNDLCSALQCIKTDTDANITNSANYFYYKSTVTTNQFVDGAPGAVLSNGMYLLQISSLNNCNGSTLNGCGSVTVDINGQNGPNMYGKDLFRFYIVLNNGVYSIVPFGAPIDGWYPRADCSSSLQNDSNVACTAARLMNPGSMPN